MLEIQTRLLIAFYSQTDRQTKCMNQKLEQYLWFFVNHRQKDWPEWLVSAEFIVDSKIYLATKVSLFMENYGWELKIEADIRRKGKIEKVTEFAARMKQIQKKAGVALKQIQEEIKKWTDRRRKEVEPQRKEDRVMLSIKDLVFKE